jgi:rhodanese-related sulfurtransferase
MDWVLLVIIAVFVVAGVAAKLYVKGGPDVSQVQLQKWMEQKADICILDVRTAREYNSGHIPGAMNIGHKAISDHLDELEPYMDKDVVVYCEVGVRARMAQTALTKAGFSRVYHLTGDMAGWRNAGLATEKPGDESVQ